MVNTYTGSDNNHVIFADGRALGATVIPIMWGTVSEADEQMIISQSLYAAHAMSKDIMVNTGEYVLCLPIAIN